MLVKYKYYSLYGYRFFEIQHNNAIENCGIRRREYDIHSTQVSTNLTTNGDLRSIYFNNISRT